MYDVQGTKLNHLNVERGLLEQPLLRTLQTIVFSFPQLNNKQSKQSDTLIFNTCTIIVV